MSLNNDFYYSMKSYATYNYFNLHVFLIILNNYIKNSWRNYNQNIFDYNWYFFMSNILLDISVNILLLLIKYNCWFTDLLMNCENELLKNELFSDEALLSELDEPMPVDGDTFNFLNINNDDLKTSKIQQFLNHQMLWWHNRLIALHLLLIFSRTLRQCHRIDHRE